MAEIVKQDPGSNEVQSPLIAGLSEGLNKISKALNLTVGTLTDEPLTAVSIDNQQQNKNRIYESNFGVKLWLRTPAPTIKRNGITISQVETPHSIDYIGGSVTFNKGLEDGDNITVSCQYIVGNSTTISTIQSLLAETSQKASRYKGYFDTVESLKAEHSTAEAGDIAFVEKPQFAVFAWDKTKGDWRNTQSIEDLANYYTKAEIDSKLQKKEPQISPDGNPKSYWAGNKTWQNVESAVRETSLDGFSGTTSEKVTAKDTVLSAIGKLQGQVDSKTSYLTGTGAPTTSTAADIGQRYVNSSTGEWYTCTAKSGSVYTWKKGQDAEAGMGLYPTDKVPTDNNFTTQEKEKLASLENYNDSAIRQELAEKVKSVNSKKAGPDGNVTITAADVQALPENAQAKDSKLLGGKDISYFTASDSIKVFTCKFLASGWAKSMGTWVQTVPCEGMNISYDTEPPFIIKTGNGEEDDKAQEALSILNNGVLETLNGQVKATIRNDPPKVDVTIYARKFK